MRLDDRKINATEPGLMKKSPPEGGLEVI